MTDAQHYHAEHVYGCLHCDLGEPPEGLRWERTPGVHVDAWHLFPVDHVHDWYRTGEFNPTAIPRYVEVCEGCDGVRQDVGGKRRWLGFDTERLVPGRRKPTR